jgi:hypothetical protein
MSNMMESPTAETCPATGEEDDEVAREVAVEPDGVEPTGEDPVEEEPVEEEPVEEDPVAEDPVEPARATEVEVSGLEVTAGGAEWAWSDR